MDAFDGALVRQVEVDHDVDEENRKEDKDHDALEQVIGPGEEDENKCILNYHNIDQVRAREN